MRLTIITKKRLYKDTFIKYGYKLRVKNKIDPKILGARDNLFYIFHIKEILHLKGFFFFSMFQVL